MSEHDQSEPLRFNEPGRFHTTIQCDGCGQCIHVAGDMITFDESEVFCYLYRQPQTPEEEERLKKIALDCPVRALRDKADELSS
ncbi:MAG: ferredoxin [Acidobacteriota bacterium]